MGPAFRFARCKWVQRWMPIIILAQCKCPYCNCAVLLKAFDAILFYKKNPLSLDVFGYFWTLSSVQPMYRSFFMPAQHFDDYTCRNFEKVWWIVQFCPLFNYLRKFHMNLRIYSISLKTDIWSFFKKIDLLFIWKANFYREKRKHRESSSMCWLTIQGLQWPSWAASALGVRGFFWVCQMDEESPSTAFPGYSRVLVQKQNSQNMNHYP